MNELINQVAETLNLPEEFTEEQKTQIVSVLVEKIHEQYLIYIYDSSGKEVFDLITAAGEKGEEAYLRAIDTYVPHKDELLAKASQKIMTEAMQVLAQATDEMDDGAAGTLDQEQER